MSYSSLGDASCCEPVTYRLERCLRMPEYLESNTCCQLHSVCRRQIRLPRHRDGISFFSPSSCVRIFGPEIAWQIILLLSYIIIIIFAVVWLPSFDLLYCTRSSDKNEEWAWAFDFFFLIPCCGTMKHIFTILTSIRGRRRKPRSVYLNVVQRQISKLNFNGLSFR